MEEPDRPVVQSFVEECVQAMPRRVTNITVNMDDDGGRVPAGPQTLVVSPLEPVLGTIRGAPSVGMTNGPADKLIPAGRWARLREHDGDQGLLVGLEAKHGKEAEVEQFLASALPLVHVEPATQPGSRGMSGGPHPVMGGG